MSSFYNFDYTSVILRKTGDAEKDKEIKKFGKTTIEFLKKIRTNAKSALTTAASISLEKFGIDCKKNTDNAIKYKYEKSKYETRIECFMNETLETIINAIQSFSASISMEELEERGISPDDTDELEKLIIEKEWLETPTDLFNKVLADETINIDDYMEEGYSEEEAIGKAVVDFWMGFRKKQPIYEYLDKLGLEQEEIDEITGHFKNGLNYYNVIYAAAEAFEERIGTEAILAQRWSFVDGVMQKLNTGDKLIKNESVVGKDYLMSDPDKKWYINTSKIMINPYASKAEVDGVRLNFDGIETLAEFCDVRFPAYQLVNAVDRIAKIFRSNCAMLEKDGIDIYESGLDYVPHTERDGEIVGIGGIMAFSENLELLEIPLTPDGMDNIEMQLTEYAV